MDAVVVGGKSPINRHRVYVSDIRQGISNGFESLAAVSLRSQQDTLLQRTQSPILKGVTQEPSAERAQFQEPAAVGSLGPCDDCVCQERAAVDAAVDAAIVLQKKVRGNLVRRRKVDQEFKDFTGTLKSEEIKFIKTIIKNEETSNSAVRLLQNIVKNQAIKEIVGTSGLKFKLTESAPYTSASANQSVRETVEKFGISEKNGAIFIEKNELFKDSIKEAANKGTKNMQDIEVALRRIIYSFRGSIIFGKGEARVPGSLRQKSYGKLLLKAFLMVIKEIEASNQSTLQREKLNSQINSLTKRVEELEKSLFSLEEYLSNLAAPSSPKPPPNSPRPIRPLAAPLSIPSPNSPRPTTPPLRRSSAPVLSLLPTPGLAGPSSSLPSGAKVNEVARSLRTVSFDQADISDLKKNEGWNFPSIDEEHALLPSSLMKLLEPAYSSPAPSSSAEPEVLDQGAASLSDTGLTELSAAQIDKKAEEVAAEEDNLRI